MNVPEQIPILCEIVGATNLTPNSTNTNNVATSFLLSDERPVSPFVKVLYRSVSDSSEKTKNREIHKTKTIYDNNNPIWAVDTRSLFVLEAPFNDFVSESTDNGKKVNSELTFEVVDRLDRLGSKAHLGAVTLTTRRLADILLNKTEERIEFSIDNVVVCASKLTEDDGSSSSGDSDNFECDGPDDRPKLALRFRIATKQDLKFIRALKDGNYEKIDDQSEISDDESIFSGDRTDLAHTGKRKQKTQLLRSSGLNTDKEGTLIGIKDMLSTVDFAINATSVNEDGIQTLRVKPFPDPDRRHDTTYLTPDDLRKAAYEPSKKWVEAGSGDLGRVYVEILRCKDLPNLDAGINNFTDSFVSVVFEDAVVQTSVINDELSPMWMPWDARAFAFNRMHPHSPLYIAVFDYDSGPTAHEGIGRCVISLENFRPDVVYTLTYALYPSNIATERTANGTVTLRIRIETPDEKELLLKSRNETPSIHVNVKQSKTLSVTKYTVNGIHDTEKFDMTLLRSYINEILDSKRKAVYSTNDAFTSLLFWRGQVKCGAFKLPLHSLALFLIGIYIVDRPHQIPSLLCFLVAWVLCGNYFVRIQHPSPWARCRPLSDYIQIFREKKTRKPTRINPNDGAKEAELLDLAWKHRVEADWDTANRRWEMEQKVAAIGSENIATEESSALQIDPLASLAGYLFPIQKRLHGVCLFLRQVNSVLTWEDSITSFWLMATCVALGIALFILPTTLLLHWFFKVLVWTFLGPWMKLVDLFFMSSLVAFENEEERKRHRQQTFADIAESFQKMRSQARIQGEDALKLKALRILKFGEYIARVPDRNRARHYDRPLPESFARPYSGKPLRGWEKRKLLPGQKLHGKMIQRRQDSIGRRSREVDAVVSLLQDKYGSTRKEANIDFSGNEKTQRSLQETQMAKIKECDDEEMSVPSHILTFSNMSGNTFDTMFESEQREDAVEGVPSDYVEESIEVVATYDNEMRFKVVESIE